MSTSAIIMMLIGCIGLWGGCGLAIAVAMKHNKRKNREAAEAAGGTGETNEINEQ